MAGFRIRHDVNRALRQLNELERRAAGPHLDQVGDFMAQQILQSSLASFAKQADPNTGRPWRQSGRARREGGQTLLDRGLLRRKVRALKRRVGPGRVEAIGGTLPDKRARLFQRGGVITPVRRRYLTIPLRAAKDSKARDYDNTFFHRRGANLYLMKRMDDGSIRALFLLVRRVKIDARPFVGLEPPRRAKVTTYIRTLVKGAR